MVLLTFVVDFGGTIEGRFGFFLPFNVYSCRNFGSGALTYLFAWRRINLCLEMALYLQVFAFREFRRVKRDDLAKISALGLN